jgi:hypothetical protein
VGGGFSAAELEQVLTWGLYTVLRHCGFSRGLHRASALEGSLGGCYCASALFFVGGGFSAAELEQVLTWGLYTVLRHTMGSLGASTVLRHLRVLWGLHCASALFFVGGGFSAAELEQVLTWGILPCFGLASGRPTLA